MQLDEPARQRQADTQPIGTMLSPRMITTAGVTHSQAVGVSPKTRCPRDGRRSAAGARSTAAGKDRLAGLDRLLQGVGFMMASEAKEALEKPHNAKSYAGPHGMEAQRYYNVLCIAYGSDPVTYGDAVERGGLPPWRAEDCADEFALLKRAFEKLIMPHVDTALLSKARAEVRFTWSPLVAPSDGLDALPLAK